MHLRRHNMLSFEPDGQQKHKTTSDSTSVSDEQKAETGLGTHLEKLHVPQQEAFRRFIIIYSILSPGLWRWCNVVGNVFLSHFLVEHCY